MAAPILQSLLLADHVYRDQATGKHIICGVFSTIFFTPNASPDQAAAGSEGVSNSGKQANNPLGAGSGSSSRELVEQQKLRDGSGGVGDGLHKMQPIQNLVHAGSPYVYFSVTELRGRKIFELRYVELRDNRPLFQAEVPVECDDPLKTIEISMPLPRLPLVAWEERSYALEVICEGQLLGSHRVLARINPAPPSPSTPSPPTSN